jgi:hypothetical protein
MGDEITTRGHMVLTSVECTTIMTTEVVVTCVLRSSQDEMGIGWDWF